MSLAAPRVAGSLAPQVRARRLSLEEYRAALRWAWSQPEGFVDYGLAPVTSLPVTGSTAPWPATTVLASGEGRSSAPAISPSHPCAPQAGLDGDAQVLARVPVLRLIGAHGGAGCSTVALALAQVLAQGGASRLIDLAEPARSGLLCAVTTELGQVDGWRLGRRGAVEIDRRTGADLPPPRRFGAGEPSWAVVLDEGTTSLGPWEYRARAAAPVVVTSAATPAGIAAAEAALSGHPEAVVVLVGGSRKERSLPSSYGAALARSARRGRLLRLATVKALTGAALDGSALPQVLIDLADDVVDLLDGQTSPT